MGRGIFNHLIVANVLLSSLVTEVRRKAQLMQTNPSDAFRGQSRSPNMVLFDMLKFGFLLVCYSNSVPKTHRFEIFDFKNAVALKTG